MVECLAVFVCISEVSFRFPNIDSLWGVYLEIWEGERIGSESGQITGFFTRDIKYFGYSTTAIEEWMNIEKIMVDEVAEFGHQATTVSFDPNIKWGKFLWFENERIDTNSNAYDS